MNTNRNTQLKKALNIQARGLFAALMLTALTPASAQAMELKPTLSQEVVFAPMPEGGIQPFAEEAKPVEPPTVQEVLLAVCEEKGYGEDCAKTLLGMLWNESSNKYNVIGDGVKARGYFQIHYKLHNITADCAEDLVCSARWSLNYLERNSYPKYKLYAVQCHNSCGVKNGYAAKAVYHGDLFWKKPLTITQAAPIEIKTKKLNLEPVILALKY